MAYCYWYLKTDLVEAENMCKKGLSVAILTDNSKRHSQALNQLAWINIELGKSSVAQMYAYEVRKLARVSGDLYTESVAVHTQVVSWHELGHYTQSLTWAIMAQSLLALCGMSDSMANLHIMSNQAEVHKSKSEYSDAWKLHTKILQIVADQDTHLHAEGLLNMAGIEVLIGVPKHDVQRNIDLCRGLFTSRVAEYGWN
jgi:hypothetical protein